MEKDMKKDMKKKLSPLAEYLIRGMARKLASSYTCVNTHETEDTILKWFHKDTSAGSADIILPTVIPAWAWKNDEREDMVYDYLLDHLYTLALEGKKVSSNGLSLIDYIVWDEVANMAKFVISSLLIDNTICVNLHIVWDSEIAGTGAWQYFQVRLSPGNKISGNNDQEHEISEALEKHLLTYMYKD